jgi:anti-sigma regulatory factor (Ser/Thr protein kinase)
MIFVSKATVEGPCFHSALPYNGIDEYLGGVIPFLQEGFDRGEPALVFAPSPNVDRLRLGSKSSIGDVNIFDGAELARNPARIIPAALRFASEHVDTRVRIVGEGIWPGRPEAEVQEFVRHEALVNVLFADIAASILCPYDADGLDPSIIEHAHRTHSHTITGDTRRLSPLYADPSVTLAMTDRLSAPPETAQTFEYGDGDLILLRSIVRDQARAAGLSAGRADDIVLAVNEAGTNTLSYTTHGGQLRIWREVDALVLEVSDSGRFILAHLAGRLAPASTAVRGRGLWMITQLCDLVQIRSDFTGTVIRMRVGIN